MNNQFKAFEDKKFEQFVTEKNKENSDEIFSVDYEEKKYWVKKGRKTSSNLFHKLCYKLLKFDVLLPAQTKSAEEAVLFESNKLIEFKENGINVPEVMGSNKDFFVLNDCGITVYTFLRLNNINCKDFYNYLDKYILLVCKIHDRGFFHGGAQSRNFTYSDNKIFAIDLEDSFDSTVNLKTLQFRDFLLLLLSMTKVDNFEFKYEYIINLYIKKSENKDFLDKLRELSKKLSFLVSMNKVRWIHRLLPRDAKGFCNLLEELQQL